MNKLTAAIGTLLAVALLAAACGGDDEPQPTGTPEPVPTFAGDLRLEQAGGLTLNRFLDRRYAPDRTALSLCVAGAEGFSVTPAEVEQVRQALDRALVFLPEVPRKVTEGCPPPQALTGDKPIFPGMSRNGRYLMPPEVPSQHQIFVYFISPEAYASSFDLPYPYVTSNEESVCEQDVCHGVSGGLYVTSDITTGLLSYAIQDYKALASGWIDVCLATPELSWCAEFWRESGETPWPPPPHIPVTRSEIDTSTWPTYSSPLGVTVSYPPDWTFVGTFDEAGQPSDTGTYAYMNNGVFGVFDDTGELAGTPGAMRVSIRPYPGTFDAELFWNICEEPSDEGPRDPYDGPPDQPIILTVPDQQVVLSVLAVLCEYHNLTPARLDSFGFILRVDMPGGQVVEVSSSTVVPTGDDIAVARAIVDSVTLTPPPQD